MVDEPKKPTKKPALKEAPATQKISKEELAALIKKAEEEDPEAGADEDDEATGRATDRAPSGRR